MKIILNLRVPFVHSFIGRNCTSSNFNNFNYSFDFSTYYIYLVFYIYCEFPLTGEVTDFCIFAISKAGPFIFVTFEILQKKYVNK